MFTAGAAWAEPAVPIQVRDGVLYRDGHPCRAIGINFYSAFVRTLADAEDVSYRDGFAVLAAHKIPFARFNAGGFWPCDWKLYREDKEAFFKRLDGVVAAAREHGVGLIPSLFWLDSCVPDLVGEPRNQWANSDSKTIAFMRRYVEEVVTRYRHEPAIWAWELGNEYSLACDLPDAASHRPLVHPALGTPAGRSEADDLTHDMIVTVSRLFAEAVRRHDPLRPVTTGHSMPRPAAQHLRLEGSWTNDSVEEYARNLIEVSPAPIDLVSVHLYPFDSKRFGRADVSYAEILKHTRDAAAAAGRALFVGEFGAPEENGDAAAARAQVLAMIDALVESEIALAALWNYDLPSQEDTINVSATNARSWLLDEIQKANERIAAEYSHEDAPKLQQ